MSFIDISGSRSVRMPEPLGERLFQLLIAMPKAGLEPARLAAPPPQDGVSANSTTSARSRFASVPGAQPAIHFLTAAPESSTSFPACLVQPACSAFVVAAGLPVAGLPVAVAD